MATEFVFTQFCFNAITKWIKIKSNNIIKNYTPDELAQWEIDEQYGSYFHYFRINNFQVKLSINLHNDDEEVEFKDIDLIIILNDNYIYQTTIIKCDDNKKLYIIPDYDEKIINNIANLINKKFINCKQSNCKNLVSNDCDQNGFCDDCWIHDYHRGDVCGICQEDDGYWIKTSCNHYFHKCCYYKYSISLQIGKILCPLCKTIGDFDKKIEDACF
jgi:hypothetical protein